MKRVSMDALEFDKKIAELSLSDDAQTNSELMARVKKAMVRVVKDELTPRQRETIVLYYYKGMGVSEIADKLGLAPSTVSRTIKRARDKIYRFLKYLF